MSLHGDKQSVVGPRSSYIQATFKLYSDGMFIDKVWIGLVDWLCQAIRIGLCLVMGIRTTIEPPKCSAWLYDLAFYMACRGIIILTRY